MADFVLGFVPIHKAVLICDLQVVDARFGIALVIVHLAYELRQLGVDQQILNQMIEEQVALIEADRNGIRVTDDELAQQILSLPGLQENGQFIGETRYRQLLQSQNPPMTASQFEEGLRRSLVVDKLRSALRR